MVCTESTCWHWPSGLFPLTQDLTMIDVVANIQYQPTLLEKCADPKIAELLAAHNINFQVRPEEEGLKRVWAPERIDVLIVDAYSTHIGPEEVDLITLCQEQHPQTPIVIIDHMMDLCGQAEAEEAHRTYAWVGPHKWRSGPLRLVASVLWYLKIVNSQTMRAIMRLEVHAQPVG